MVRKILIGTIRLIVDSLSKFPLASDLFLKFPRSRKTTNICKRYEKWIILWSFRCVVFAKKGAFMPRVTPYNGRFRSWGREIILVSPSQLFLSINLMSWNFFMIFWDVMMQWLKVSNLLYRRCQVPSTFLGDSEKWWILEISSNLRQLFKIGFSLAKYAFNGLVTLGPKSL